MSARSSNIWNQGLCRWTASGWRPVRGLHSGIVCVTCAEKDHVMYEKEGSRYCGKHKPV